MDEITKDKFFKLKTSPGSHRKSFAHDSGIQDKKKDGSRTFSVSFDESIGPIYEKMTGNILNYSPMYNNYWHYIEDDDEYEEIKSWEQSQGTRVFLRDCLSISLAMDYNFEGKTSRTHIGTLEDQAKNVGDSEALRRLASLYVKTISELPFYSDTKLICAVPSKPGKPSSLPVEVAKIISGELGKEDVTEFFRCNGPWRSIKAEAIEKKWDVLEQADLKFERPLSGDAVVLIDDKYQSGVSLHFIARELQKAGAKEIFGLCAVKTLRDTDNQ